MPQLDEVRAELKKVLAEPEIKEAIEAIERGRSPQDFLLLREKLRGPGFVDYGFNYSRYPVDSYIFLAIHKSTKLLPMDDNKRLLEGAFRDIDIITDLDLKTAGVKEISD